MCGINGIVGIGDEQTALEKIAAMNDHLAHRGPDAEGTFFDNGFALGHRRLSVIDTSPAGNQPFLSYDNNLVLVFNGEIYNYLELKAQLPEYLYKTSSDTEVLLAAYQKWGIAALQKLNGMFSFALFDKRKNELFLVRDRMGIKPLYYAQQGDKLIFSSEIRGLVASGLVDAKLDRDALVDYLRYQTVHQPKTILEGVHLLAPGHYIHVSDSNVTSKQYWGYAEMASSKSGLVSPQEAKQEIYSLLFRSVAMRMRADVPFGAFLSGGIDSSIIVGLMSRVSSHPVKTFAVTFDEGEFSEAKYSRLIAKRFETDHTEIKLTPNDFLKTIPNALAAMDHPSGDGPNTYLISEKTKQAGVTMAMSGLGGDELFAGYDVFKRHLTLLDKKWLLSFPKGLRKLAAYGLSKAKPSIQSQKVKALLNLDYFDLEHSYPLTRQVLLDKKIKGLLKEKNLSPNSVFRILNDHISYEQSGGKLPELSKVSFAEIHTYMQHTLLRDSDQMSMAHALELRTPFLDHNLVEYTAGIQDKLKYPHTPKQLLVESVGDLIPSEIVNRPKMGFTLPWKEWMKNELKHFCEERIYSLAQRDYFVAKEVESLWNRFLANDPLITWSRVWYLVVLEDWLSKMKVDA